MKKISTQGKSRRNVRCEDEEKEKEDNSKCHNENPRRQRCPTNPERNSSRNSEKNPELSEVGGYEGEVLEKLGEYITMMSNTVRIKMLEYCQTERTFTEIMLALRLNPASLKHHINLLQGGEFIEKTGAGKNTRYKTTAYGRKMLNFVGDIMTVVRAT